MHEELAFVIGRSAGKYRTVRMNFCFLDIRFERRFFPKLQRIRRLHIVMSVHENSGQIFVQYFLTVHDRITFGLANFHRICSGVFQVLCAHFCTLQHFVFVGRICTDGGDFQQFKKFINISLFVLLNVIQSFLHFYNINLIRNWISTHLLFR